MKTKMIQSEFIRTQSRISTSFSSLIEFLRSVFMIAFQVQQAFKKTGGGRPQTRYYSTFSSGIH